MDPGIEHCFIASPSNDNNSIHQNMALSFDPTDLTNMQEQAQHTSERKRHAINIRG